MNLTPERCSLSPELSISRVLTGMWQVADIERRSGRLDVRRGAAAMAPYVAAGLTSFDMADHYGSAELIAGEFAAEQGHDGVELLTKWVPKPGPSSPEHVRAAVNTALRRLRAERLDVLQFHAWNYADPSYLDTLWTLQELRREGLIRELGLTNVDTAHLGVILHSGIEVVSNQICFSLLDQRAAAHGMLEMCGRHGIGVLAFGTLAGGFLTERWVDQPEPDWDNLETWSQMKYGRFIRVAGGWEPFQQLLGAVHQVAARHDTSMAAVASRYVLDQPAVAGVIVGARLGLSEHVSDTLQVFALELDDEDHQALRHAMGNLQPIPGDCGDEYRRPPFLTAAGDLSDHLDALPPPYAARTADDGRTRVLTGTVWEDLAGFSRAVRQGNRILLSGTTATHAARPIGGSDPAAQTHFVIDKLEGALQSLGACLHDVVRTRIFIRNEADWEPVSRAHGARFADIGPANTLLRADIIGDEYLVEMEAEAIVTAAGDHGDSPSRPPAADAAT